MKADLTTLSFFSFSMAKCLSAGLMPARSIAASSTAMKPRKFAESLKAAEAACDSGATLAESLAAVKRFLPHFYLPVVHAGEIYGRLEEAFLFLHEHCSRLAPTATIVRNTWLFPLVCIAFGIAARACLFLYFGMYGRAVNLLLGSLGNAAILVGLGYCLFKWPPFRHAVDRGLLNLPVVRETEINLSATLFFEAFSLVYKAGAPDVLAMFDVAAATIRNTAIQEDLRRARSALQAGDSFENAFQQPTLLEPRYKGILASGAVSGSLDKAMEQVARLCRESLEFTLATFHQFFFRMVCLTVSMSIAETVYLCLTARP